MGRGIVRRGYAATEPHAEREDYFEATLVVLSLRESLLFGDLPARRKVCLEVKGLVQISRVVGRARLR